MITGSKETVPLFTLKTLEGATVYRNGVYNVVEDGIPVRTIEPSAILAGKVARSIGQPVKWLKTATLDIPKPL